MRADVLHQLVVLQSLRAARERELALQAARRSQTARRQAEQAQAALANRQAGWQRRLAADVMGVADFGNARAAIDAARGLAAEAQARLDGALAETERAREAYRAADAAATALQGVHAQALKRQRRAADERQLLQAEDRQTARLTR